MSHQIRTEQRGDREILTMVNDASGAEASLIPSYGFNLFDLKLPAAGAPRSLVVTGKDWEANPERPARHGFPVLFPFPNRIRNGQFHWNGSDYQLPLTKPPHAIHGFALDAGWSVIDQVSGDDFASITGRFDLVATDGAGNPRWPGSGSLTIRYQLGERSIRLEATVSNTSDVPLPFGLGFHPYFRLPFEAGGDLSKTKVIIPAAKQWVLKETIPTGEILDVDNRIDFRRGKSMAGLQVDDVLTGLLPDQDGQVICRLIDEGIGAEFQIRFLAEDFRELVVFTPQGTDGVIAVEPYTQTTDAINLQAIGVDAGLRIVEPGASTAFQVVMETIDP